jgi:glycosyltransferase involved in cell wall biosynthesis/predicted O-methyltransferase YrrM
MASLHSLSSAPRVCLVAPEFIGPFPNGGVGTACYWEARTLAAAGFDVTVLYTGPTDRETPEHWARVYREAGAFTYVDLAAWAAESGDAAIVHRADHPCAEARTSELVLRFLRGRRFDLLLFQEFLGHGARTLQARRSGDPLAAVPAVVTLHSCRQWIYDGMQRTQVSRDDVTVDFLERESARLADFVVTPSRHMAEWARAQWRLATPMDVIPYCYDASEAPAGRVDHRGPVEHLVFFGRLETRKGLQFFCRALAASAAARGPIRKVTFLGKRSTVEGQPSDAFIRHTLRDRRDLEIEIIDSLGSLEALEWLGRQSRTLVVAPSLVDNLPYALIELFTRRIPFLSTRVGGIPEIVGAANDHTLAAPTADGLAEALARVHRHGRLAIDYAEGYASARANAQHVDYLRGALQWRRGTSRPVIDAFDIVVVDDAGTRRTADGTSFAADDPSAAGARFLTWEAWRALRDQVRPAIFVSSAATLRPGAARRLLDALRDPRVDTATSYWAAGPAPDVDTVAPLGAALESGWSRNVFAGPCLAAMPAAFDAITSASARGFHFWPAGAAVACAGLELAVVPEVLIDSAAAPVETPEIADAAARQYQRQSTSRFDVAWALKHARTGAPAGDRDLYTHLLAIPDERLQAWCGLGAAGADARTLELRQLRRRLGEVAARWTVTMPRAFIYGAGEHTRAVLALEPEIGHHIAGFIDRRPLGEFLGRPCLTPEDVSPAIADAILYSSREFERDMHARLAALPVEHVRLYAPSPAAPEETTSLRVRRRLGHAGAPVEQLRAMHRPPAWAQGFINHGDAEFLLELVTGLNPRSVLEVGVASGASSAALLFALDHLAPTLGERRLISCDVRATCYFDDARATGSAVQDMYPDHRTAWTLDTSLDARRLAQKARPGSVDLLFIDANHAHPWPLLDLLHLAVAAKPGSWVALHDIELPVLHPQFQVHGPKWLFEAWPFNKIHGVGVSQNIGAVQLPVDPAALVPLALALLDRPWEHAPTAWHVALPDVFREVTAALAPRLAPDAIKRAG